MVVTEGDNLPFEGRVRALRINPGKELTYISTVLDGGGPFVAFRSGEIGMVCFQANPEVVSHVIQLRVDNAFRPTAEAFRTVNFLKGLLMQGTLLNGKEISVNIHFVRP